MFFADYEPEKERPDPSKTVPNFCTQIYVYENGAVEEKPREFRIIKKRDNFKEIKAALDYGHLRLFNSEGAEYFEDDLSFVKNKMVLYASRG